MIHRSDMAGSSDDDAHTSTGKVHDQTTQHSNGDASAHHAISNGVGNGLSSEQTSADTTFQHPMNLDAVRDNS